MRMHADVWKPLLCILLVTSTSSNVAWSLSEGSAPPAVVNQICSLTGHPSDSYAHSGKKMRGPREEHHYMKTIRLLYNRVIRGTLNGYSCTLFKYSKTISTLTIPTYSFYLSTFYFFKFLFKLPLVKYGVVWVSGIRFSGSVLTYNTGDHHKCPPSAPSPIYPSPRSPPLW